ncbi:hypothetical protein K1T73_11840 [Roseovarius sp. SCSIO 43702]|uniref:hypothetical protein n=1 Tax=Roseovarius sp. SCSIO 43702 TaxID=2823043 RepID=UPI001C734BD0|nr:hypothetical protein [Roseovarius sp. SCSIO 43702]QYX55771.1 hypothetical protein K1T73_11840 [Roseovarius sp. SCSIO 43702]
MKHLTLAAAFTMLAVPAFAGQCPADMAAIDEAMATAQLSEAEMAEVKALRAEGEEQHAAGDHEASVETLAEAKAMLGIE